MEMAGLAVVYGNIGRRRLALPDNAPQSHPKEPE
jgi:hypothetical protein